MTRRHATLTRALGELLVVADGGALSGIYFPAHWHPPAADTIGVEVDARGDALITRFGEQLAEYLDGTRTTFDLPLAPTGDEFQQAVWAMLRDIRFGETTTYGTLAARLGDRNLARRVGGAVGRNPLSIVVPCHRVVGADGSLTGYAGGLERKRLLLELEGAAVVAQARLF
ncbi:methylated-DNA--[protein]-cysteine S-methyltransferase [Agromyces sp. SYSU K20354]|uniref:methylated-DNA--[protein]-cysteine S-methyltransferase n=1 Tax=Agromyces cavernae TaxID=2898659 RepID=UPI001E5AB494|nr:methylated-DNA--[protein]-cysteine S-methyltransferase [Agromyces cavernae]MCD2441459.1 methylated-DNA--[protein]-cysteine S-methyltransferase [Agromyces cavernae]